MQRHNGSRADIFNRTLGQDIVFAHGVDLRIEKFDTEGQEGIDGKNIDNAAAHTKLSDVLDLHHMLIAQSIQPRHQVLMREHHPEAESKRGTRELRCTQPSLRGCADIRKHDNRLAP